jgi:hypothetical protein
MTDPNEETITEFDLREVSMMADGSLEIGGYIRGTVAKAGEVQADGTMFTAEAIQNMADKYPALSEAIGGVPSHIHPPRGVFPDLDVTIDDRLPDGAIAAVDPVTGFGVMQREDGTIEAFQDLDDLVANEATAAAVHAEINRRVMALVVKRTEADALRDELRDLDAKIAKESADLLDLMRDAGIATATVERYSRAHRVTVVVRHDYDIVDQDAAVAALLSAGLSVPTTTPRVDPAGIKRLATILSNPIPGVEPRESAHLRWT